MKWRGRQGSSNIEDRRRMGGGSRGGRGAAIGGVGGLGAVAVVLIGMFLGVDLTPILGGGSDGYAGASNQEVTPADEEAAQFVSVTLADTEQVWSQIFQEQLGQQYRPVTLVLFKGATQSGCGGASAQTGPFYCPADGKVYLDTDFFVTLERQLGAGGDFAAAYVVAHEVGHYVQDQLGILSEAQRGRQQGADSASVRTELQADCFAGVWASYAQNRLGTIESGDVEEAMNAAAQIGDDTLQQEAGQGVRPDSFTHGSSEQRQRWFYAGFETGDLNACDTFRADRL
jgi:predicted metalloprotease